MAAGSGPIGKQPIEWHEKGDLDFSQVKSVRLDEYVGPDMTSDQSDVYFMGHNFMDHISIDPGNVHIPCGTNMDTGAAYTRYDDVIRNLGGIDLQLLGLGPTVIPASMNPVTALPRALTGWHRPASPSAPASVSLRTSRTYPVLPIP